MLCAECKTEISASQLRLSEAVRCASLCRRVYHSACVDLPSEAIKLLLNPNILWQCDGCVVANDSHSKIDELDCKIKTLECLYQNLNSKFSEAFPTNCDVQKQTSNVTSTLTMTSC